MDVGLQAGRRRKKNLRRMCICDPEHKLVFQHVFGIQPRHLKMNNFMNERKKRNEKNLCCVQKTEEKKNSL